jgi:site-specific DNA recombinase
LLAVISEEQVRSMLRSIRAGHERAARDGRWQGQAPFGYRVVEGRLQIHEPDAAIVREMFSRYADGDGAHILSLWLEDSAIPAPRGGARWPLATVIRLLRNPVYIGKAQYNKRKNIRTAGRVTGHAPRDPDEYIVIDTPPLIDLATWERVQQRQATRRRQHGIKGHAYAQTLIPRVYCVECGARCYAAKHSRTGTMYYQHERRFPERYGDCKAVGAINAAKLDTGVWYRVELALADPDAWLEARKQSRAQSGQEQERAELARLEDAIAEARKGLERLDDAHVILGTLSAERYQRLATELGARLERLTARHSDLQERATSTEQQDEADRRRAARLASYPLPTSPSHEQKRAAVDALIDHVKVRDGSPLYVEIEWRV